jgi:hypothetical protein
MPIDAYPSKGSSDTLIIFGVPELFESSRPICRQENSWAFRDSESSNTINRRIGQHLTPATWTHVHQTYESIMSCKAPAQGSGFYNVEITRNGRDFITTGFVFQYGGSTCYSDKRYVAERNLTFSGHAVVLAVHHISPNLLMRSGGTRVLVSFVLCLHESLQLIKSNVRCKAQGFSLNATATAVKILQLIVWIPSSYRLRFWDARCGMFQILQARLPAWQSLQVRLTA